jgi:hypothetical protein
MSIFQKHGINAEIDDEMIPVIDELNKLELKTLSCCSGHDGRKQAQISFDVKDATVLINNNIISINWRRNRTTSRNG